jgi:hypothetical protein
MPDIWGLALRLGGGATPQGDADAHAAADAHADVLLASVGNLGVPWRFVPVPASRLTA